MSVFAKCLVADMTWRTGGRAAGKGLRNAFVGAVSVKTGDTRRRSIEWNVFGEAVGYTTEILSPPSSPPTTDRKRLVKLIVSVYI